jgi:steroid delta-isomerase-like uncharacterized protein
MKKLILILPLALILCFLVGCQDKEAMVELDAMKAQAEVEEQNIALIMRNYEVWNSRDIEATKEIFSPDYVYHSASGQDESLEQMIENLKQQMAMFPDSRTYSVEDILAKGDIVVSRYIFKGTLEGDIEGFHATGKKIETTGIEIWRVENGKIVESWDIHDYLGGYQQLGFELKPPKEGEK